MHVLVTGHTGFKGAWLCLLLRQRGLDVSGIALDPDAGSLFERASVAGDLRADMRLDIRQANETIAAIQRISPDVVIHLAAQPLVRKSYADPRWTMETNVMGTLSILEGISETPSVGAALIVTTDKVYRNTGQSEGYVEEDSLGGHDPYSASKAMADILVSSWESSFPGASVAIARAGNVIGGGDVSKDRLVPDLINSFESGRPAAIRNPDAVRPWQHVLDCLHGYLLLLDALHRGEATGAWNFGPEPSSFRSVRELADQAAAAWGDGATWIADKGQHLPEEAVLTLDASRARDQLGWSDALDFPEAVGWTVDWAKRVYAGEPPREVTLSHIAAFETLVGERS